MQWKTRRHQDLNFICYASCSILGWGIGILTNAATIKTEQLQILMDLVAEENTERILSSKGLQTKINSFKEGWMKVAEMITSEKNNLTINGLLVTKTDMSLKHWQRYSLILEESASSGKLRPCLKIFQQNKTLTCKTTSHGLSKVKKYFEAWLRKILKSSLVCLCRPVISRKPPWTDSL